MASSLAKKRQQLLHRIAELESCAVAFSAGVDSTVVAKASQLAVGNRAVAVTAVSPSLAEGEIEAARELASLIGIRHVEVETQEMSREGYHQNGPDRCYFCKTELYSVVESMLDEVGAKFILNGANTDDLGDYRPGLQAAEEHRVISPLVEAGINKAEVRQLAADWGLPIWDKPASPCLSSRIAYGEEVTPERLRRIDAAEQLLRAQGVSPVRVRLHRGELARVEVPDECIVRLASPEVRRAIIAGLKDLGFAFVTLDLEGFRSGSLNRLIQLGE